MFPVAGPGLRGRCLASFYRKPHANGPKIRPQRDPAGGGACSHFSVAIFTQLLKMASSLSKRPRRAQARGTLPTLDLAEVERALAALRGDQARPPCPAGATDTIAAASGAPSPSSGLAASTAALSRPTASSSSVVSRSAASSSGSTARRSTAAGSGAAPFTPGGGCGAAPSTPGGGRPFPAAKPRARGSVADLANAGADEFGG